MKRIDFSPDLPVVGRERSRCRFAVVLLEQSDIDALVAFHDRLHPAGCTWVHPKAQALQSVIDNVSAGMACRLAVSHVGDQADPGRAVAEALELAGDLESFDVIHDQVLDVERRHRRFLDEAAERRHGHVLEVEHSH